MPISEHQSGRPVLGPEQKFESNYLNSLITKVFKELLGQIQYVWHVVYDNADIIVAAAGRLHRYTASASLQNVAALVDMK